jgi:hypothetical protein
MKALRIFALVAAALLIGVTTVYASKPKVKTTRNGNIETVESENNGKIEYRIIYTYDGTKKIKGEYWEAVEPKKKDDKAPKSNIFAGTAVAKKYESVLADAKVQDLSGIEIGIEKDGLVLKSVKTARYNKAGQPEYVAFRGYATYPVLGLFNLKTDWEYTYDAAGKLSTVKEKNMNVDSLLLNLAVENTTKIDRNKTECPTLVTRTVGAVPPVFEKTEYQYDGNSANMKKTVYHKCGIDTAKRSVEPSETITTIYGSGVSWEGMKKYDFTFDKTIKGFSVYDEINKKQQIDGSNFTKMSIINKGMFLKNMYGYYKNEQKGPKWRMGELPDVPEPFLIYKDNVWYK